MGEVYAARDTRLDRPVALKTLLESLAGRRFVMVRDDATIGRLRVVLNWRADER